MSQNLIVVHTLDLQGNIIGKYESENGGIGAVLDGEDAVVYVHGVYSPAELASLTANVVNAAIQTLANELDADLDGIAAFMHEVVNDSIASFKDEGFTGKSQAERGAN